MLNGFSWSGVSVLAVETQKKGFKLRPWPQTIYRTRFVEKGVSEYKAFSQTLFISVRLTPDFVDLCLKIWSSQRFTTLLLLILDRHPRRP